MELKLFVLINLKTMGKKSPKNIKLKQWKIKKCQKNS